MKAGSRGPLAQIGSPEESHLRDVLETALWCQYGERQGLFVCWTGKGKMARKAASVDPRGSRII
jgi:hypothetical protein